MAKTSSSCVTSPFEAIVKPAALTAAQWRTPESGPAPALDSAVVARAFPFYLHLDEQLRICSAGVSLRKAVPAAVAGVPLRELFRVRRPRGVESLNDWRDHLGELCTLTSLGTQVLTLRGSAECCEDGTLMMLVSPVLGSLADVSGFGLSFNDFAKHDSIGDSLLMAQTTRMSSRDAERLSERLRGRTEQMATILELSKNGTAYFDQRSALQHVNSALLDMLGMERAAAFDMNIAAFDEWIGQRLAAGEACRCPLQFLMTESPDAAADVMLRVGLPEPAVIHVSSASTFDGGWVFYFRDVTRETEVDRMKSEFLSTAAHELRTPMVSVFGFTELLLNRPVPESKRRDVLQTIHRQSSLLINMVNELLDLARIEARQGKDMKRQECRLADLVEQAVNGIMVHGDARQVQLSIHHPSAVVHADSEKMQRALTNVLSNAYKYSPQGGPIELNTLDGEIDGVPAVGVCVRDRGLGMNPEQIKRVFERFFRADPSGNIPGTGLGMSLVKEIVELHRGRVALTSQPGQGTQVTLWLPLLSAAGPRHTTSTIPLEP